MLCNDFDLPSSELLYQVCLVSLFSSESTVRSLLVILPPYAQLILLGVADREAHGM